MKQCKDEESKMNYTGEQYAGIRLNADLTLKEAFQMSRIQVFSSGY